MLKGIAVVFVLAFGANWLAERFVIKDAADASDSGFVPQTPGKLGWDDVARALVVALAVVFGGKFARKLLGGIL
jgi:hypothetical protein